MKKCRHKNKLKKLDSEKSILANQILDLFTNVNFEELDISKINSENSLYVIGNGFDLIHNVKSRYYDFYKYLCKKDELIPIYMEALFDKDDIWGDFEDSLAHLDRSVINGLDAALEDFNVYDEDDDDFTYADYYSAIEETSRPVTFLTEELPELFRKWINKLQPEKDKHPLCYLLSLNAKYINFNYTEFLESIYGIPNDNILYIHGCRKNRKEKLILGHGNNIDKLYDKWYEKNKKSSSKNKNAPVNLAYFRENEKENYDDYITPLRYYALNEVSANIEGYYDDSKKDTAKIIENNKLYFYDLNNIETIIVLGHSFSKVDYPYFEEIIKNNSNKKTLKWYISWYNIDDLIRITLFLDTFQIGAEQVILFCITKRP